MVPSIRCMHHCAVVMVLMQVLAADALDTICSHTCQIRFAGVVCQLDVRTTPPRVRRWSLLIACDLTSCSKLAPGAQAKAC